MTIQTLFHGKLEVSGDVDAIRELRTLIVDAALYNEHHHLMTCAKEAYDIAQQIMNSEYTGIFERKF